MRLNNNRYEEDYVPKPKHKYEPVKKKNERLEDYMFEEDDQEDFDRGYEEYA